MRHEEWLRITTFTDGAGRNDRTRFITGPFNFVIDCLELLAIAPRPELHLYSWSRLYELGQEFILIYDLY